MDDPQGSGASQGGVAPESGPQPPPAASPDEPSATELTRFRTFMLIQLLFLVASPFAGGFQYSLWSMLDSALLILSLGTCAMGFVLETKAARRLVFRLSAVIYGMGVLDMSINILVSGILGWRGWQPPQP